MQATNKSLFWNAFMWGILRLVALVIAFLVGITFTLKNDGMVTLNYLIGETSVPTAFVILGFLIFGWIVGVLSMLSYLVRMKMKLRDSQKAAALAEKEVRNLRNLPIKDDF